jgi:hypothetical protein
MPYVAAIRKLFRLEPGEAPENAEGTGGSMDEEGKKVRR